MRGHSAPIPQFSTCNWELWMRMIKCWSSSLHWNKPRITTWMILTLSSQKQLCKYSLQKLVSNIFVNDSEESHIIVVLKMIKWKLIITSATAFFLIIFRGKSVKDCLIAKGLETKFVLYELTLTKDFRKMLKQIEAETKWPLCCRR